MLSKLVNQIYYQARYIKSYIHTPDRQIPCADVLGLVYPSVCGYCGEVTGGSGSLCDSCTKDIRFLSNWSCCVKCGGPFGFYESNNDLREDSNSGHLCGDCIRGKYSFISARSITFYTGTIRELIHEFKYEGKIVNGDTLSSILAENYPFDKESIDLVVPVPLRVEKLRVREYNQSAIFAVNTAKRRKIGFDLTGLKKLRETKPQFELNKEKERLRNVRGAYVEDKHRFKNKSVLLVDDVFTTGATSNECSTTLCRAKRL